MTLPFEPIPPGEILLAEFLVPLSVSQNQLARDIDVPVSRVAGIVSGKRSSAADTALRLGAYLGTSPELWLRLQNGFE
jgi:antitoxin HigA-1